jgi:hypothetical protein
MPSAEIPHRIAEARRCTVWRRDTSGWQAFEGVGDGEIADLAALRGRLARFTTFEAGQAVRESARRICDGRLAFLGEDWPSIASGSDGPLRIPPTFWFYDPITGKSWPDAATSSFDVYVRATGTNTGDVDIGDGDMGDVKYVWEPNRLQMLHPLAAVIAGTQDQKARQVALPSSRVGQRRSRPIGVSIGNRVSNSRCASSASRYL